MLSISVSAVDLVELTGLRGWVFYVERKRERALHDLKVLFLINKPESYIPFLYRQTCYCTNQLSKQPGLTLFTVRKYMQICRNVCH